MGFYLSPVLNLNRLGELMVWNSKDFVYSLLGLVGLFFRNWPYSLGLLQPSPWDAFPAAIPWNTFPKESLKNIERLFSWIF